MIQVQYLNKNYFIKGLKAVSTPFEFFFYLQNTVLHPFRLGNNAL